MFLWRLLHPLSLVFLLGAGTVGAVSTSYGEPLQCYSSGGCHEKCPPYYIHCTEGPPKIKFKCGCPKPVCDPCMLDHFGYYRTCWQPWPCGPDGSHCPLPPAGSLATAQFRSTPSARMIVPDSVKLLPAPRKSQTSANSSRPLYRDEGE
jgi:hypothetical protein